MKRLEALLYFELTFSMKQKFPVDWLLFSVSVTKNSLSQSVHQDLRSSFQMYAALVSHHQNCRVRLLNSQWQIMGPQCD